MWIVGANRDLAIDDTFRWIGSDAAKRIFAWAGFDTDNPDPGKARQAFLIYNDDNPLIRSSYKLPFADVVNGKLVATDAGLRAAASRLPQTDAPQDVLDRARSVIDAYQKKMEKSSVLILKDTAGRMRWIAVSSNGYQDLDGEIVSTKALEDDVERADADEDYGPLRWWHVPGVDIGDCDFNMMHGRMLVESGTFRDGRIAKALERVPLQVSIGFRHLVGEPIDGVYSVVRRVERSLVPSGKAANPFTSFGMIQEESVTKEEKIAALKSIIGDEELVRGILGQIEDVEKSVQSAGIAFKQDGVMPEGEAMPEEEEAPESGTETVGQMSASDFSRLLTDTIVSCLDSFFFSAPPAPDESKERGGDTDRRFALIEKELKETKESLQELLSGIPRGYRASEDASTVLGESHRLKAHGTNGVGDFINFVLS